MGHVIYALVSPGHDLPYYVGRAVDPDVRFDQHMANPDLTTRSLLDAGQVPTMIALAEYYVASDSIIDLIEQAWINRYIDRGAPLINRRQLGAVRFKNDDDDLTLMIGDLVVAPPGTHQIMDVMKPAHSGMGTEERREWRGEG